MMSVCSADTSTTGGNKNYTSLSQYIKAGSRQEATSENATSGTMIISIPEFDTRTSLFSKFTRYVMLYNMYLSADCYYFSLNYRFCINSKVNNGSGSPDYTGDGVESEITNDDQFQAADGGKVFVWRRFKDFIWLHQQLCLRHPGCIIPPLPKAKIYGRFTSKFIEARKRALVILHSIVSTSKLK